MFSEGNKVAVRVKFMGTHTNNFYGIEPTNKPFEFEALEIFLVENGIISESWGYWPSSEIKRQLTRIS